MVNDQQLIGGLDALVDGADVKSGLDSSVISEDYLEKLRSTFNYMEDPIHKIYTGSKSASLLGTNSEVEYSEAPHTFMYIVPPDCTRIDDDTHIPDELRAININVRKMLINDVEYYSPGNSTPKTAINNCIPVLSNFFDQSSISPIDLQLNTTEFGENFLGLRMVLPTHIYQNRGSNEITVTYRDIENTKYGHDIISNIHRAWMLYMNFVRKGIISPGRKYTMTTQTVKELTGPQPDSAKLLDALNPFSGTTMVDYIKKVDEFINKNAIDPITKVATKANNALAEMTGGFFNDFGHHTTYQPNSLSFDKGKFKQAINYMGAMYLFKLGIDGRTIHYYSKSTGIYPKQVSYSNLYAGGSKEHSKTDITYQTQYNDDMDTNILVEFNAVNIRSLPKVFDKTKSAFPQIKFVNPNNPAMITAVISKDKSVISDKMRPIEIIKYKLYVGAEDIIDNLFRSELGQNEMEVIVTPAFTSTSNFNNFDELRTSTNGTRDAYTDTLTNQAINFTTTSDTEFEGLDKKIIAESEKANAASVASGGTKDTSGDGDPNVIITK